MHYKVRCFKHLQVLCPRHHKSSLCSWFVPVPLSLLHLFLVGVWTSRTGKQGFSLFQGSSPLRKPVLDFNDATNIPPILSGQSLGALSKPSQHFTMAQCTADLSSYTLQWYGALLELAYHLYWQSRMATAIFSQKEIIFCMTVAGQPSTC